MPLELQAALEAEDATLDDGTDTAAPAWPGGLRHLLHGKRKKSKYAKCNRCSVVRCQTHTECTGHCKKRGKLFFCKTNRNDPRTCKRGSGPYDPETLEVDSLDPLSSLIISTGSNLIGCAEVAGQGTGCPARGTRITRGPDRGMVVEFSSCMTRRYELQDCESPFYPFGFCMCSFVRRTARSGFLASAPCRSDQVELDPSSVPMVSRRTGGFVGSTTTFADYVDDDRAPNYTYTETFSTGRERASFTLEYYRGFSVLADRFTFVETISADYDAGGQPSQRDIELDDSYFNEVQFDAFSECYYRCFFEGGDVLGTVGEDFYSVHYTGTPSCEQCMEDSGSQEEDSPAAYELYTGDEADDVGSDHGQ